MCAEIITVCRQLIYWNYEDDQGTVAACAAAVRLLFVIRIAAYRRAYHAELNMSANSLSDFF